ncbi:MAG: heme A synthase [Haloferacaceae archaeon]
MRTPSPPAWLTFRRFAGVTTALTLVLITLGVYTAATGSGLACSQQWPLCDGGLFPSTLPSFVEWFHRLVAMITGWFILGTTAWAWLGDADRRTRAAATLALVVLPFQIAVGAITVTLNGALPQGYSTPTHAAHMVFALTIFGSLVLTTLFAYDRHDSRPALARARFSLLAALVLLPPSVLFSRVVPAVEYSPPMQGVFYGLSLVIVAGVLAATVLLGRTALPRLRWATGGVLGLVIVHLLLGRDLVFYTPVVHELNAAILGAAFGLVAVTTWLAYRRGEVRDPDVSTFVRGD